MAKIGDKISNHSSLSATMGLWLNWSLPQQNEPNRTKIDDLVTKAKFGDRKS